MAKWVWIVIIIIVVLLLLGLAGGLGAYFINKNKQKAAATTAGPGTTAPIGTTGPGTTASGITGSGSNVGGFNVGGSAAGAGGSGVSNAGSGGSGSAAGGSGAGPSTTVNVSPSVMPPATPGPQNVYVLGNAACAQQSGFTPVGTVYILMNPNSPQMLPSPQIIDQIIASGSPMPGVLAGIAGIGAQNYGWKSMEVCSAPLATIQSLKPGSGLYGLSPTATQLGPVGFLVIGSSSPFSLGVSANNLLNNAYWTYPYLIDASDPTAFTLGSLNDPRGTTQVALLSPNTIQPSGFTVLGTFDPSNPAAPNNSWMGATLIPGRSGAGLPPAPPVPVPVYVPPPPPPPPPKTSLMSTDTPNYLGPGDKLTSPSGLYIMTMQSNGDASFYSASSGGTNPPWRTGTDGNPGSKLILQASGDLAVVNPSGVQIHNEGVGNMGVPPYRLSVLDMGAIIISDSTGKVIWSRPPQVNVGPTAPTQPTTATTYPSSFKSTDTKNYLGPGDMLVSPQQKYYVTMQAADGNAVAYSSSNPGTNSWWSTGTYNNPGALLVLPTNGNLEVTLNGNSIHDEGIAPNQGTPPYTFSITDLPSLEIRDANNTLIWSRTPPSNWAVNAASAVAGFFKNIVSKI